MPKRLVADSGAMPSDALHPHEFAALVQRVWAMSERGLQARATVGLAEHAEKLSLQLAAMPPCEAVRLLRLIVRHRLFLEPDLYEKLPSALIWLPFEAHEFVDLLVEVAETGDSRLAFLMSFGMVRYHPPLSVRVTRTWPKQESARSRACVTGRKSDVWFPVCGLTRLSGGALDRGQRTLCLREMAGEPGQTTSVVVDLSLGPHCTVEIAHGA